MNDYDDKNFDEQFGDILDDLSGLAEVIDNRNYPGHAWPVRRRRNVRRILSVITASAAAVAALFVIAILLKLQSVDQGKLHPPISQVEIAAACKPIPLSIPTEITVQTNVAFDIPSIAILSCGEVDGITWDVPAISFPSSSEWSNNNDL